MKRSREKGVKKKGGGGGEGVGAGVAGWQLLLMVCLVCVWVEILIS